MFELTNKNLGTIVAKKEVTVEFPYDDIFLITKIKVSCGCSTAYNMPKDKKIVVQYTPTEVSPLRNSYKATKAAFVSFLPYPDSPEMEQQLTFEVEVVN